MLSSPYFTRLAAAMSAGLMLAAVLLNARVLTATPALKPMAPSAFASKECAIGEAVLAAGFAPAEQVLSVAPVGPPRLQGEPAPAPLLRVIGRPGAPLAAQAPARAEIVAVAKSTGTSGDDATASWSVAMIPCADHIVVLDGLSSLDRKLLRRLGADAAGGADFVREIRYKVAPGEVIGAADHFDVGFFASPGLTAAKRAAGPARYLSPSPASARCPIENMKRSEQRVWKGLFGDAKGERLPTAEGACATSRAADARAAEGVWLTDPSHGARANKVVNAALTADIAAPDRLVFTFFGRLGSVGEEMFDAPDAAARRDAARMYLTARRGRERINAPFADVVADAPYCYENLRAGLNGPRLKGVLVLKLSANAAGAPILRAEAIPDVRNCENLPEPWSFTGSETAFFRASPATQ